MGVFYVKTLARVWIAVLAAVAVCGCPAAPVPPNARAGAAAVARADSQWSRRAEPRMDSMMIQTLEQALGTGQGADQPGADVLWRLARAYWWKATRCTSDKASKLELLEKGRDAAERAAAIDPTSADAHHWYAACLAQSAQVRGILQSLFMVRPTVEALERALAADPNHARTHYFLAELLCQLPGPPLSIGNKQRAVEEARIAVRLDARSSSHHLVLGKALAAAKQYPDARAAFNYVLTMEPSSEDPEGLRLDQEEARAELKAIEGK